MEKTLKSSDEVLHIIKKLQSLEGKTNEIAGNNSDQFPHKDEPEKKKRIHKMIVDSIIRERWF